MTVQNGSTIEASDLRTNLDASRADMDTAAARRRKWHLPLWVPGSRSASADKRLRSCVFTPQDDCRLDTIFLQVRNGSGVLVSATLEVDGDEDENRALLEKAVSHSVTPGGAFVVRSATQYIATSDVIFLLAGIRYRFVVLAASGTPDVCAVLVLEAGWRRA